MAVRQVRVGDVLSLHRVPVRIDESANYRQIGLYSWGKGFIHRPSCLGFELSKLRYFQIPAGALVISNIQAWEAAIAVSTNAEAEFIGSNRFLSYVPRTDDVDVRYLLHYFLSEPGLHQIRQASPGTQVRNRTLGQQLFERLEIPLPDVTEQQRIAVRLDRLAQMQSFQSAAKELDRSIHSLLRDGPSRPLAEVLDLELDDFLVDPDAVYARAGVLGFGRGLFSHGPMRGSETKYAKLRHIHTGQLVMSRLKAFEGAVAVTTPAFDGAVVSQEFATFTPKAATDLDWVDALCRWPAFWDALRATSTGIGARRERVSAEALLSLEVPYPGANSRRRISALQLSRLQVASLEEERERLRKVILPAARNETFGHLT